MKRAIFSTLDNHLDSQLLATCINYSSLRYVRDHNSSAFSFTFHLKNIAANKEQCVFDMYEFPLSLFLWVNVLFVVFVVVVAASVDH